MRLATAVFSYTSRARARVGTKLAGTKSCCRSFAIHAPSFLSVFLPGMLRICCEFASLSWNSPASTFHTGLQDTPIDSMATSRTP